MKSIKTLWKDMHLTHGGMMVRRNKANNIGTASCTPHIMTLGSSGQPKRQGCHNYRKKGTTCVPALILGKREVSLEAETLSTDPSPLSPPDPPSDKESPPLAVPTFLHLFHNLSSDFEPEDSDCDESDSYGGSSAHVDTFNVDTKVK
ncbi:hypothetical protein DSO57_1004413 [Entomophthora muscae]|uniref:Uncharacterized protein n=1 Tax=Entomophthora muscae TaxID=34485 RepID=A0ACC2TJD9_9FUNG|nr:hypothetical protein DSO57_1004413 [Entomophthora muscae]